MLPARCSQPPCMNMLVNSVSQIGVGPGSCGTSTVSPPTVIGSGIGQVDPVHDLERDRTEAGRELRSRLRAAGSLEQEEDGDVEADEGQADEGRAVAALVLVADREHRPKDRAGLAP